MPNSETGDIPAAGSPEEGYPTVKRVAERSRLKAQTRHILLKTFRKEVKTVQKDKKPPFSEVLREALLAP